MAGCLTRFDRYHAARPKFHFVPRENLLKQRRDGPSIQALQAKPDDGGLRGALDSEDRMEIGIQGDDGGAVEACPFQNLGIGCREHSDLANMGALHACGPQLLRRVPRQVLIEQ